MLCLDFDPTISGHVMVGAKSGMYEFQDGKFVKHYTTDNSALESPFNPPSKDYTIVTSVKYDAAGNLWALNSLISNSIKCLSKSDGKWTTYKHSELSGTNSYDLEKAFISKTNGKMWFVNNNYNNTILYSYDYANDVLTKYGPSIINQDGTSLGANYIFSPVEDREENVWVAPTPDLFISRQAPYRTAPLTSRSTKCRATTAPTMPTICYRASTCAP